MKISVFVKNFFLKYSNFCLKFRISEGLCIFILILIQYSKIIIQIKTTKDLKITNNMMVSFYIFLRRSQFKYCYSELELHLKSQAI